MRGDHGARHFIRALPPLLPELPAAWRGCCRACLAAEAGRARARARLERWYVSHIPIWAFACFFQKQANAASHAADAACHAADAASHAAVAACHAAAAASHAADAASYAADVAGHAADASWSSSSSVFEHGSSGGRSVTFPYGHLPVYSNFSRYQREWLRGDHGVRHFIRGPHRACRDFLPPGEGAAELEPNSSRALARAPAELETRAHCELELGSSWNSSSA